MTENLDVTVTIGQMRGIPVTPTAVDVVLLNGPAVLRGWSLRDISGETPFENEGSVTSPAAGATIVQITGVPAGTYTVNWEVELAGTLAAADSNNFALSSNAATLANAVCPAVAGVYPQPALEAITVTAGTWAIKAIALGTVGAIYSASFSLEPALNPATVIELQDGNQILGESAMYPNRSDHQTLPLPGLHVAQQIKLHVVAGQVTGVVYAEYER
jgi:hypothetical protein